MQEEPEFRPPDELAAFRPRFGLVLGSGLGSFAEALSVEAVCPYSEIEGLPVSRVPGHAGRFLFGKLNGTPVAVAQGRVHLYENWTAREVAAQVRFLHQTGVRTLVLTNAAGIVNEALAPGRWMLLADHLNLARQSPLTGSASFVDQSAVYCPELRARLQAESRGLFGEPLAEGVYAWVNGPEYETPAEIRMLRGLGADAVGMSTVPEAIQARALGMKVVALSCLTNWGAGLSPEPLDHHEVVETGRAAATQLVDLLARCASRLIG